MLTTVVLDGKLSGPWVDEARAVVTTLRARDAVCLNLENLSFADGAGIDLLCRFRREGVQLIAASPLIEGLIAAREPGSAPSPTVST
jgi:ABC-type transporter Mla MlaB component